MTMGSRLDNLTALRALAAFWVVIHHYGHQLNPFSLAPFYFNTGYLAVPFFFILSGFILVWNYASRQYSTGRFWLLRLTRLAPAYLAALVIMYLVMYGSAAVSTIAQDAQQRHTLLINATFILAFFPMEALFPNVPAWSVSVEVFFYFLFPLLLFWIKQYTRLFYSATALLLLIMLVAYYYMVLAPEPSEYAGSFLAFHPFAHLYQFMLGMACGHVLTAMPISARRPVMLHPLIPVTLLLVILPLASPLKYPLAGISMNILFAWLIVGFVQWPSRILSVAPMLFLGEISYGIYIYQTPLHDLLSRMNDQQYHLGPRIFFIAYAGALILTATLSYHLLELPLLRLARKATGGRKAVLP